MTQPLPTPVPVTAPADTPAAPSSLRCLVWNIQFAAGRDALFFYDGGDAVSVRRATVERTLERIAAAVHRHAPDVILLQEVDRGSRRTEFIDQHAWLAAAFGLPCHASTEYHRVRYVPAPAHEHLGRVDMHLGVYSRYRLLPGLRRQLPLLRESRVRQHFNLRRAALEAPLATASGAPLLLLNTHLSAFSRGDGTLQRQIARLGAALAAHDAAGRRWLLAGDFNALPPGDDPSRLRHDRELYGLNSPLAPLFARYASAVPLRRHLDDPAPYRTWVPFGAERAERAIDHTFVSAGVRVVDAAAIGISDHLPMIVDLELTDR